MEVKDFDFNDDTNVNSNPITDSVTPNSTDRNTVNQATGMNVLRDPNSIVVTITDPSPIVILYGAGAAGKTMLLIRLARYLQSKGYKVVPDRTFCDSSDVHYQNMCDSFMANINTNLAAERTGTADFMLLKVMDQRGRMICQLLEAPGEHFFDEVTGVDPVNKGFPPFMQKISSANNRRTWVFIVEKNWKNSVKRSNYAQRIINLQNRHVKIQDKVIFTCTKADMSPEYYQNGVYNTELFYNDIQNQYSGIFSRYLNNNPITRFFNSRNFDFIPFSAGAFNPNSNGGYTYTQSNEKEGTKQLWEAILKTVKGGW
ncbi:hypothetical protein ACIRNY_04575 [Capnocytophaga canimorsus]|uniref:hypothetical protein n=1 Tax=Capnocytophaga canimorsus TaxID=28188 RepID=UPI001561B13C|nr:hypothetical protein [Capnocytophaga canimorsus]